MCGRCIPPLRGMHPKTRNYPSWRRPLGAIPAVFKCVLAPARACADGSKWGNWGHARRTYGALRAVIGGVGDTLTGPSCVPHTKKPCGDSRGGALIMPPRMLRLSTVPLLGGLGPTFARHLCPLGRFEAVEGSIRSQLDLVISIRPLFLSRLRSRSEIQSRTVLDRVRSKVSTGVDLLRP